MRIAIYARVSKDDGSQDAENQVGELREFCKSKGWTITQEYIDHQTGKTEDRPHLQAMFKAASRHKFDILLVWALDRLTRGGIAVAFESIKRLKGNGVEFWSYTEEHFRTLGPVADLLIAISAWIADQERKRISERTKAGLARVRAKGKRLGRPEKDKDVAAMRRLRAEGLSLEKIAAQTGVSRQTVLRLTRAETATA